MLYLPSLPSYSSLHRGQTLVLIYHDKTGGDTPEDTEVPLGRQQNLAQPQGPTSPLPRFQFCTGPHSMAAASSWEKAARVRVTQQPRAPLSPVHPSPAHPPTPAQPASALKALQIVLDTHGLSSTDNCSYTHCPWWPVSWSQPAGTLAQASQSDPQPPAA